MVYGTHTFFSFCAYLLVCYTGGFDEGILYVPDMFVVDSAVAHYKKYCSVRI